MRTLKSAISIGIGVVKGISIPLGIILYFFFLLCVLGFISVYYKED
jgi:hypothetical protein